MENFKMLYCRKYMQILSNRSDIGFISYNEQISQIKTKIFSNFNIAEHIYMQISKQRKSSKVIKIIKLRARLVKTLKLVFGSKL